MENASRHRFGIQVPILLCSGTIAVSIHHCSVKSILKSHYRKALGALVVYDITKEKTFHNVKKWIEGIRDHASPNVVIVMVGNKTDLKN